MALNVGDVLSWERSFSVEDVRRFTAVSADAGDHHVAPDADGRLLVHGLLTATLPTRVGGALDFLAREMHFEFLRPVFSGQTIRCEVTIAELSAAPKGTRLVADIACINEAGKLVLSGQTSGVIRAPLAEVQARELTELRGGIRQ